MIKGAPRPRFQLRARRLPPIRLENEPYLNRGLVSIKMLTKSSSFEHWTFSRNRARLLSHFESAAARGPLLPLGRCRVPKNCTPQAGHRLKPVLAKDVPAEPGASKAFPKSAKARIRRTKSCSSRGGLGFT